MLSFAIEQLVIAATSMWNARAPRKSAGAALTLHCRRAAQVVSLAAGPLVRGVLAPFAELSARFAIQEK